MSDPFWATVAESYTERELRELDREASDMLGNAVRMLREEMERLERIAGQGRVWYLFEGPS